MHNSSIAGNVAQSFASTCWQTISSASWINAPPPLPHTNLMKRARCRKTRQHTEKVQVCKYTMASQHGGSPMTPFLCPAGFSPSCSPLRFRTWLDCVMTPCKTILDTCHGCSYRMWIHGYTSQYSKPEFLGCTDICRSSH
jgi:hypothetical protein